MKFAYRIALCVCTAVFFTQVSRAAGVLQVTNITSDFGESFPINTTITFTAEVSNSNSVTTYEWDFGDDSALVTTSVPTVTHVFTSADDSYFVTCTADNHIGDPPDSDFESFEAFEPPLVTDPVGANAGDPPQANPDNGVTFTINQCQGGFVSGALSIADPAVRAVNVFTTTFGDDSPDRHGSVVSHRYRSSGIFILATTANQDGSDAGMTRKTLAFSDVEINGINSDPNVVDLPLDQRKLTFKKLKGKFHFTPPVTTQVRKAGVAPTDTVTVSWSMTLPAGFDINTQVVELAIGNVKDSIPLKSNGSADLKNLDHVSPFKSVKFKFPRLKKGQTFSANPVQSVVTVQMSSADLTTQGFDTEGISPREHQVKGSKGPFSRSVQVATMFSGVAFTGLAPVTLSVSSDSSFGSISGRK